MPIAIVDMGTNTFHLLIAKTAGPTWQILYNEKVGVKMGEKGINEGLITESAKHRALKTLAHFTEISAKFGIRSEEIKAFATSALRNANNKNKITQQIKAETGITVSIIDGQQEAELIYEGVKLSGALGPEKSLILDIGGGSVECIIANQTEIFWKESFEVGGQRLLEKFKHSDPIANSEIKELNYWLCQKLVPLQAALINLAPKILTGSSGSFDSLVEIMAHKNNKSLDGQVCHPLPLANYYQLATEIIGLDHAGRLAIAGMIPLRADMIVVAICLINLVLDMGQFSGINVSNYALKEGVLAKELMKNEK